MKIFLLNILVDLYMLMLSLPIVLQYNYVCMDNIFSYFFFPQNVQWQLINTLYTVLFALVYFFFFSLGNKLLLTLHLASVRHQHTIQPLVITRGDNLSASLFSPLSFLSCNFFLFYCSFPLFLFIYFHQQPFFF